MKASTRGGLRGRHHRRLRSPLPLWLDTNNAAVWSLIVLGVLIAVAGLLHMARRRWSRRTTRWACSACCCSSPVGDEFHTMTGAAWTAWVVGALAVVVSVVGMPAMSSRMHGHGGVAAH